jgi:hypothetical protein
MYDFLPSNYSWRLADDLGQGYARVEYPRPRGGGLLLRDCITLLYQHRLYDGIKRYQLLGGRFYHLLILHHYRLLGPETHPRRSSPATTMVAGTMGSHG